MEQVRRRDLIRRIVQERSVRNQEALQLKLAEAGIDATQATISRDLRAIGAVKGSNGYMFPSDAEPVMPASGSAVLGQLVTAIHEAAGMVVMRTSAGSAQLVALELDRHPPADVVGTVAGDDTVFIAVRAPSRVREVSRVLQELAGLSANERNGS